MKRIMFAIAMLGACTDADDPFALDHPRVLAVRSEPAHAAIGGSACIDVLVGDTAGHVVVAPPTTIDVGGLPVDARGCVQAPAGASLAPVANIAMAIDGEQLLAFKQLVFADYQANPAIAVMPAVSTPRGTTVPLAAPDADASYTFAWYTSIGTLAHYRSDAATLTSDVAGDGTLVLVVRDDQGGVAWQLVPVHVD